MPNDFGNAVEPPQTKNYVEATEQLVTEIFVRDLAKSLAFFQQLGFELLRQQGGFAELTWEGHKLFLDRHESAARARLPCRQRPRDGARRRCGVEIVQRQQGQGHHADRRPLLRPAQLTVADPDGYGIRFASLLGSRKKP